MIKVPECPHCEKPTKRISHGSKKTLMYYPPVYNEQGINTNPDKNKTTTYWTCLNCQNDFTEIIGHEHYEIKLVKPK